MDYEAAAKNWATGMRISEPYMRERRAAAQAVSEANRAKPKPCSVKGCKRSGGYRGVCAKHYELVPFSERVAAHIAILSAQMRETSRQRRRLARIARDAAA